MNPGDGHPIEAHPVDERPVDANPDRSGVQRALLATISWYQRAFSWRPSPCRFYPSCSNYAYEAIEVHGPWSGLGLTLKRLGRCRPFGGSGIDHVPSNRESDQ